jgi:hypothetical protein
MVKEGGGLFFISILRETTKEGSLFDQLHFLCHPPPPTRGQEQGAKICLKYSRSTQPCKMLENFPYC